MTTGVIERLMPSDLVMLWPDDHGWPQDIGVIAILDDGLLTPDGSLPLDELRRRVSRRLHRLPRFRQVIYRPRLGLGKPLWVDVESLDLTYHIDERAIEPPGDDRALLQVCEELRRLPYDRSRPLWRVWFLTGLADGRMGVYIRIHHAAADGVAGVVALGALVDTEEDVPDPTYVPWTPSAKPDARALFFDNVRRRLHRLRRFVEALRHPVAALRRAATMFRGAFELLVREGDAPRSSVNRRVGPRRRLAIVRSSLTLHKSIARSAGAKVNDVLLAAVAEGLRDLLTSRGEPLAPLRAMVPVSLHAGTPEGGHGNNDGGMLVPLPLGTPDRDERLRLIAFETAHRKRRERASVGAGLLQSAMIQRMGVRLVHRQRMGNVYVANVPGPPVPLFLAGARIIEMFPAIPLLGNMTLGVGALSYAGQFNITVVGDFDHCPDLDVFVAGVERYLSLCGEDVAGLRRDRVAVSMSE